MSAVPLFKNRHGNVMVVKGNNMFAFNSGRYFTTDPEKIRVLLALAESRDQGVYIDVDEPEIDPDAATPMEVMKRKIIAEYLASQSEIKDMGTSSQKPVSEGAGHTASSVIMGNSLAEMAQRAEIAQNLDVENKEVKEEDEESKQESASMKPQGAALAALQKMKK